MSNDSKIVFVWLSALAQLTPLLARLSRTR